MLNLYNTLIITILFSCMFILLIYLWGLYTKPLLNNNDTTIVKTDSNKRISKRVCLIIIAFGEPETTLKLNTLKNNIDKIKKYNYNLDIHLNLYTIDPNLVQQILEIDPTIIINQSKGYLLELLYKFNKPEQYVYYDHIIMFLDDVEITNVDFDDMILKQTKFDLDIISPKIINATYDYMYNSNGLRFATSIEFFMYIFTPLSYKKYFEYLDKNHSTMWGYDVILYYGIGLKCAIDYNYSCNHLLKLTAGGAKGFKELRDIELRNNISLSTQTNPLMPLTSDDYTQPIVKAYYGTNDITDKIINLYNQGNKNFTCSNIMFDDHNSGQYKYLVILYKRYNQYVIDIATEQEICKLQHHKNTIKLDI